jgi:beta-1,4-mannosyl-glycoprotein beta-1,4-N-acetylglucosaminyltransferase
VPKPKIYDCFSFFNEEMLLQLRLDTLWDYVDYFVISEASYTHKGHPRDTIFDLKKFKKYESKIRYCRLDAKPIGPNDFWKNENFIRNNIVRGLTGARPGDLILISDLDEIPNPSKIFSYDPRCLRGDFLQSYYSYYLNNLWVQDANVDNHSDVVWKGTKITTFEHFTHFFSSNATNVRHYKSNGIFRSLKRTWFNKRHVQNIEEGGWHFTWVLSLDDIINKMNSTAHIFEDPKYKDKSYLEKIINANRDFQDPNKRYVAKKIDSSFPEPLRRNTEKYSEFIMKATDK